MLIWEVPTIGTHTLLSEELLHLTPFERHMDVDASIGLP